TLGGLGHFEMWRGNFALAEDRHSEAAEIAGLLGANRDIWELLKVELFAWQGREDDARRAADILMGSLIQAAGAGVSVNLAPIALGLLAVASRNYPEALDALWPLFDDDVPPHGSQALAEIVEAAAGCDRPAQARSAFERLELRSGASGTDWARGLCERSAAFLADAGKA